MSHLMAVSLSAGNRGGHHEEGTAETSLRASATGGGGGVIATATRGGRGGGQDGGGDDREFCVAVAGGLACVLELVQPLRHVAWAGRDITVEAAMAAVDHGNRKKREVLRMARVHSTWRGVAAAAAEDSSGGRSWGGGGAGGETEHHEFSTAAATSTLGAAGEELDEEAEEFMVMCAGGWLGWYRSYHRRFEVRNVKLNTVAHRKREKELNRRLQREIFYISCRKMPRTLSSAGPSKSLGLSSMEHAARTVGYNVGSNPNPIFSTERCPRWNVKPLPHLPPCSCLRRSPMPNVHLFPSRPPPTVSPPSRATAGVSAHFTTTSNRHLRQHRQHRQQLPPADYRNRTRCDVLRHVPRRERWSGRQSAWTRDEIGCVEPGELFQNSRGLLRRVHRLRLHADAGVPFDPSAGRRRQRRPRVATGCGWLGKCGGAGEAVLSDRLDGGGRRRR